MSQTQVNLGWRDLNIAYNIDLKSVTELAAQYGIDFHDMKAALRSYGFTIRKGEVKPAEAAKPYTVVLTDTDKIVVEEPTIAKAPVVAPTATVTA